MAADTYPDILIDGAYQELFAEFLVYKRGQGCSYGQSIQHRLRELSRFLGKMPLLPEIVSRGYYESFVSLRGDEKPANQSLRIAYARQFCLFLRTKGYECFVPPEHWCRKDRSFTPRIITEEEIGRIIAVADSRQYWVWPTSNRFIFPMLLRMLWCCGMRVGEALALRIGDVDVTNGVLAVRKAKNNNTRMIPMSASCAEHVQKYWKAMGFDGLEKTAYFYPSPRGGRYACGSVGHRIKQMMAEAGVFADGAKTPRIHDIRHSYAVAALEKMIAEGMDCYCELPLLSIYMGHSGIRETEHYLRLTSRGVQGVEDAMATVYIDVFPEVG
jgi:integrase